MRRVQKFSGARGETGRRRGGGARREGKMKRVVESMCKRE
jgi:hypothetical protein